MSCFPGPVAGQVLFVDKMNISMEMLKVVLWPKISDWLPTSGDVLSGQEAEPVSTSDTQQLSSRLPGGHRCVLPTLPGTQRAVSSPAVPCAWLTGVATVQGRHAVHPRLLSLGPWLHQQVCELASAFQHGLTA